MDRALVEELQYNTGMNEFMDEDTTLAKLYNEAQDALHACEGYRDRADDAEERGEWETAAGLHELANEFERKWQTLSEEYNHLDDLRKSFER